MTNNVGLTISVGNIVHSMVYNSYSTRQVELVTLNIIVSVVLSELGWVYFGGKPFSL